MNGAKYLARTLVDQGVTHVFLVPAILRHALVEMEKLGIRRITAHSEHGAAYMADGFARVSRKPAVAMAQSVGAANLASGLQDAFLGHSPVIALTGRKASIYQHRNAYQEVRHAPIFEPVTKFNVCVEQAEQLPFLLRQLFREATIGAPGPVHADLMGLAGDVIEQGDVRVPLLGNGQHKAYPAHRPAADPDVIDEAMKRISEAKRPIIVAGGGTIVSGAHAEVTQLAEVLDVPVATSNDAKGIISEHHRLSAGVVGSYSQQCANQSVSEADLVIFIGSATGDQVTLDWTIPRVGTDVIQIDINPSELGRNYPNALGVFGDARTVLQQILSRISTCAKRSEWTAQVSANVRRWQALIEPQLTSDDAPIRPERLCCEISNNLPADAVLVADTGYSCVWAGTLVAITQPTQLFIRAAGSLGWAFPAAMGAKLAAPDRPVICFSGDGAFLYHLSELETARRWGINTVTIVNNNSFFGQSIPGMARAYGNSRGNFQEVVQFKETNFARIAEDFGCLGIRVESASEIAPAIQSALSAARPVVIDVVTSADCHPPEIWRPNE